MQCSSATLAKGSRPVRVRVIEPNRVPGWDTYEMGLYARSGSFDASPGEGDRLEASLLEAAELLGDNADCLLYIVGRGSNGSDTVHVFEAWTSKDAHAASLQDERITELIERARPLIAGMAPGGEFHSVGGKGLPP